MSSCTTTYVAPVTPLTAEGSLNLRAIGPLYRLLRSRGAEGLYVAGGTGEGMLLTVNDRKRLLEAWRDAAGTQVPLMVHVGCVSLTDARDLASHASQVGASAISAMTPSIFAPRGMEELIRFFSELTEAAPSIPFYYYHNPANAIAFKNTAYDFLVAAHQALPTLEGVKFTSEDLMDLSRCLRFEDGQYRIFYGKDEFLLGAHATGVNDFIGGAFNVVLPLVKECLAAFNAGRLDHARAVNHRIVDVVAVLRRFGGLPAVKATMELLGVPCGPLLPPLRTVSELDHHLLFDALRQTWPEIDETIAAPAAEIAAL